MNRKSMLNAVAVGALLLARPALPEDVISRTYDGLARIEGTRMAEVYVDPEADFSRYHRVIILEPGVAFVKNWQREHREARISDMERIKRRLSELFRNVFTDVLEEGGYPVVAEVAEDVLVIRPAIVDLDVIAPDLNTAARARTFVTSAGAMTLYLELFDGPSGAILARAIDRRKSRDTGRFHISSSVYNSSEARKVLTYWATLLRDRLDEIHDRPATQ